jgi:hypothetical protein
VIISSLGLSEEVGLNQVEVFDKLGNLVAGVRVLATVPDAAEVSICDVSTRPEEIIAVAAVFRSKKGVGMRPAAALLYFDFKGKLLSAFALEPSREILRLSLDENLNAWTATTGSGDEDPSLVPLVVEYDRTGKVKNEFLKRNMFPMHAKIVQQNPLIGSVNSGYETGVFWFWLPGSTDLVTIRTAGGTATVTKTGLPEGHLAPLQVARQTSGALVIEAREVAQGTGKPQLAYYVSSPSNNSWTRFHPTCEGYRLLGNDNGQNIFRHLTNGSFCESPSP